MLVVLKRDQEEVGCHAAQFVANAIRRKASLTLGLATDRKSVV
jgi:hypothetical protein